MATTRSSSSAGHPQRFRQGGVEPRQRALVALFGVLAANACGGRSTDSGTQRGRDAQTINRQSDAGTTARVPASSDAALTAVPSESPGTPSDASAVSSNMLPPTMQSASAAAATADAPTATPTMSMMPPAPTSNNSYLPVDNPPGDLVDCEARSRPLETSCSYNLVCDGVSVSSTCQLKAGTGSWTCSCYDSTASVRRDFQLTGDDLNACVDAVTLCVPSAEPELVKECVDFSPDNEGYSCYSDLQCSLTAALDSGALVELTEFRTTRCDEAGVDVFNCYCGGVMGNDYTGRVDLSGVTASQACVAADELCGMQPSGEVLCEPLALQEYANSSCSAAQVCGKEVTLPESGITTTVVDTFNTSNCSIAENGDWNCECYGALESQSSAFLSPASAEDACSGALLLCPSADVFDPVGLPSCTTDSVSGMGWGCVASATCIQGGSVAGAAANIWGAISNNCTRGDDGSWQCRCSSLEYSESFTLEGDEDAPWDVCSVGIAMCSASARFSGAGSGQAHFSFELPPQSADAGVPAP